MSRIDSESRSAVQWWRDLQPNFASGARNPRADRAALARLRRGDLTAAMQEPATFDLFRRLDRHRSEALPEVALCAATLASVREDDEQLHAARQLGGRPGDPDARAAMSPLRFRRLIEAQTLEDRLTTLRRAVALVRGSINVRDLAAACLDWSEPRRNRWVFEYYAAGFAAPAPAEEDTPA